MILEGLVTTTDPSGTMHLAAMGPEVDAAVAAGGTLDRLLLKPFPSSQTGANLLRSRTGVFHAVDDCLLLARVVTGTLTGQPPARPAAAVQGFVLEEACRAYEFEIVSIDRSQERLRLEARVMAVHEGRPFLGWNRGRHAVMEGAILVTRLHLLGAEEVGRQLRGLAVLVEKTGGPREREAFGLLATRAGLPAAATQRPLPDEALP